MNINRFYCTAPMQLKSETKFQFSKQFYNQIQLRNEMLYIPESNKIDKNRLLNGHNDDGWPSIGNIFINISGLCAHDKIIKKQNDHQMIKSIKCKKRKERPTFVEQTTAIASEIANKFNEPIRLIKNGFNHQTTISPLGIYASSRQLSLNNQLYPLLNSSNPNQRQPKQQRQRQRCRTSDSVQTILKISLVILLCLWTIDSIALVNCDEQTKSMNINASESKINSKSEYKLTASTQLPYPFSVLSSIQSHDRNGKAVTVADATIPQSNISTINEQVGISIRTRKQTNPNEINFNWNFSQTTENDFIQTIKTGHLNGTKHQNVSNSLEKSWINHTKTQQQTRTPTNFRFKYHFSAQTKGNSNSSLMQHSNEPNESKDGSADPKNSMNLMGRSSPLKKLIYVLTFADRNESNKTINHKINDRYDNENSANWYQPKQRYQSKRNYLNSGINSISHNNNNNNNNNNDNNNNYNNNNDYYSNISIKTIPHFNSDDKSLQPISINFNSSKQNQKQNLEQHPSLRLASASASDANNYHNHHFHNNSKLKNSYFLYNNNNNNNNNNNKNNNKNNNNNNNKNNNNNNNTNNNYPTGNNHSGNSSVSWVTNSLIKLIVFSSQFTNSSSSAINSTHSTYKNQIHNNSDEVATMAGNNDNAIDLIKYNHMKRLLLSKIASIDRQSNQSTKLIKFIVLPKFQTSNDLNESNILKLKFSGQFLNKLLAYEMMMMMMIISKESVRQHRLNDNDNFNKINQIKINNNNSVILPLDHRYNSNATIVAYLISNLPFNQNYSILASSKFNYSTNNKFSILHTTNHKQILQNYFDFIERSEYRDRVKPERIFIGLPNLCKIKMHPMHYHDNDEMNDAFQILHDCIIMIIDIYNKNNNDLNEKLNKNDRQISAIGDYIFKIIKNCTENDLIMDHLLKRNPKLKRQIKDDHGHDNNNGDKSIATEYADERASIDDNTYDNIGRRPIHYKDKNRNFLNNQNNDKNNVVKNIQTNSLIEKRLNCSMKLLNINLNGKQKKNGDGKMSDWRIVEKLDKINENEHVEEAATTTTTTTTTTRATTITSKMKKAQKTEQRRSTLSVNDGMAATYPSDPLNKPKTLNSYLMRLESIKYQILMKLGLKQKPNITRTIPKTIIMSALSRADEANIENNHKYSNRGRQHHSHYQLHRSQQFYNDDDDDVRIRNGDSNDGVGTNDIDRNAHNTHNDDSDMFTLSRFGQSNDKQPISTNKHKESIEVYQYQRHQNNENNDTKNVNSNNVDGDSNSGNKFINNAYDYSDANDAETDDFYGRTREIIIFAEKGNYFNRQPLIEFASTDELHEKVETPSTTIDNNSSMQPTNQTSIDANQLKERNAIKCKNDLNVRKRKRRRRRRKRRQTNDTQFASLLNSENSTNIESTTANIQMRPFIIGHGNGNAFDEAIISSSSSLSSEVPLATTKTRTETTYRVQHKRNFQHDSNGNMDVRVRRAFLWIKVDAIDTNKIHGKKIKSLNKHKAKLNRERNQMRKHFRLWVFHIVEPQSPKIDQRTKVCATKKIHMSHLGWQKLDVTSTVRHWYTHGSQNRLKFLVDCSGCAGRIYVHLFDEKSPNFNSKTKNRPNVIQSDKFKSSDPSHPFLVIYTDSNIIKRVRRHTPDCSMAIRGQCCKQKFYVSFDELGWSDWIIAPHGYYANYCQGNCNGLRTPDNFRSYHSHVIEEYRKMNRLTGIQPCCTPLKFSSMSLIYYEENQKIIKRDLPKMIVDECGCP